MSVETGIEKNMLEKIFARFTKDGKVFYEEGYVCVKNFLKHQNTNSLTVQKGIENELMAIPRHIVMKMIGYGYRMDMVSYIKLNLIKLNSNNKDEVTSDLTEYSDQDEMQNASKKSSSAIYDDDIVVEDEEEFENGPRPKKAERKMTPVTSINTGKKVKTEEEKTDAQELRQQSIKLGTHFEQSIGRRTPDKIIQVAGKKGIVEVDLNLEAGKRLIKKFGEDTVRGFIGYFFELRGKIAQDQRKYIPVVGNVASLEQKLPAVLNFIEAQGVNPFNGQQYKIGDAKLEGKTTIADQWEENMRKRREAKEKESKQ